MREGKLKKISSLPIRDVRSHIPFFLPAVTLKINASELFKHRFHDHAMETKSKFFFSILFIIYLLRSLKF